MENWDLQAVVGGCGTTTNTIIDQAMEFSQQPYLFAPLTTQEEDEFFIDFTRLVGSSTAFNELEELYKPFYPISHPTSPPTSVVSFSMSVPQEVQEAPKKPKNINKEPSPSSKKRKNQNKRVEEVKSENLFSDVWAWRKYGQKPIKGSPYPRSYYRCSSSKGCSARKQVERSCSNPETFIVTYTAEHNHGHPTRRNSLAGSTRSKFPSSKTKDKSNINKSSNVHEFIESKDSIVVKEEARISEEDGISHKNVTMDMMLGDEIFPTLEVLDRMLEGLDEERAVDGWFSDQGSDNFPSPWLNFGHSNTVTGAC